ncbi:MAG: DUF1080 domain-containing protein [Planctomycetes bacterium]|nr:DUF1080 domain-containing protein [Planctomycetota bacterium]
MRYVTWIFCLVSLIGLAAVESARAASGEREQFFNGKNLDGWQGLPGFWSVKDGAIVGTTGPKGCSFNTFLCSKRKYQDFELKFQVRLKGQGWSGNSGVQIRSKIVDAEHLAVAGPQADMGENYWGSLYGELFGGMMKQADSAQVNKVLKKEDFNDYAIRVSGKHVTIRLNGLTTVDQDFPNLPARGIIAWQLHQGPPLEVIFRNIQFRDLTRKGK